FTTARRDPRTSRLPVGMLRGYAPRRARPGVRDVRGSRRAVVERRRELVVVGTGGARRRTVARDHDGETVRSVVMPAALWDMDGTLIDSEDYHWRAWRDTMEHEGVPITHEHFVATFGQRNDVILPHWLGADAPAERIARVGDAKEALYRDLVRSGGITPLPGAAEWVRRLHADGWRQAIASSAPRANVETIV